MPDGRLPFYFFVVVAVLSTYFSWIKLSIGAYQNRARMPLVIKYGSWIVTLPAFIMHIFILWISGIIALGVSLKTIPVLMYTFIFASVSIVLLDGGRKLVLKSKIIRTSDLGSLFKRLAFFNIIMLPIVGIVSNISPIPLIISTLSIFIISIITTKLYSSGGFKLRSGGFRLMWIPMIVGSIVTFEFALVDAGRGFHILELLLFEPGGFLGAAMAEFLVVGAFLTIGSNEM